MVSRSEVAVDMSADINTENGDIILQNEFLFVSKKHSYAVNAAISRESIVYHLVNNGTKSTKTKSKIKSRTLQLSDVVGCRSVPGEDTSPGKSTGEGTSGKSSKQKKKSKRRNLSEKSACLQVYVYRYNKKPEDGGVRRREIISFVADQHETRDENVAAIERWRLVILCLLRGVTFSKIEDLTEALLPNPPHYLVCVNPFSGKGKANHIFKHQVGPIFGEAGISFDVVVTEFRGHGAEIAKNLDLDKYNAVIIVSGDGLLHEFINGFNERADRENAFQMPLGIIPGGSGNAVCVAILARNGEQVLKNVAVHAAVRIVKGRPDVKDLVQVVTKEMSCMSFLSVAWGLIADIDIESERFRFLGETRFFVGTVHRIAFLRRVPGRLAYLPVEESRANYLIQRMYRNEKRDDSHTSTPGKERASVVFTEEIGNQNSNACSSAEHPSDEAWRETEKGDDLVLPDLSEPVPSTWTVLEGEFIGLNFSYNSHLSSSYIAHRGRSMDEGVICLQVMDGSATRMKIIGSMDAFETGNYQDHDHIQIKMVKAFRVEPLNHEGIMTVDGERIHFGPIQGAMTSSTCRMIM